MGEVDGLSLLAMTRADLSSKPDSGGRLVAPQETWPGYVVCIASVGRPRFLNHQFLSLNFWLCHLIVLRPSSTSTDL